MGAAWDWLCDSRVSCKRATEWHSTEEPLLALASIAHIMAYLGPIRDPQMPQLRSALFPQYTGGDGGRAFSASSLTWSGIAPDLFMRLLDRVLLEGRYSPCFPLLIALASTQSLCLFLWTHLLHTAPFSPVPCRVRE